MSVAVYKYGALPPAKDGAIREQIKLAQRYYNKLVEAENNRRQSVWRAIWCSDIEPIPPHEHATGEELCDGCKAFWELMQHRYYAFPALDVKPYREAARNGGLYWGTYLIPEQDFAAAWKKTKWSSSVRFRPWRKGGAMGSQIQQGKILDNVFRIEKAEDPRSGKRAGQRHILQVRIGSDEKKKPIWSDPIRFEMHRPLQGRPTWVKICLSYRGEREYWSVNITCADVPARIDNALDGTVAIDVGWRALPNNHIRLAYAKGDNGNEYELTLNPRWRERIARADRIRAARDEMLNIIKRRHTVLSRFEKPEKARGRVLEEELNQDIELEGWQRWERHMQSYEIGCRRKSVAARREQVRMWLRMLRRRYATAVIKDSAHKEMKATKKAKEAGLPQAARKQGHHAAPGEIIEEACRVFGRQTGVAVVKAPGTTATCIECGHESKNGVGAELMVVCERCGAREDRDRVSTRNLLRLYFAGDSKKPTARKTTARFAKRHKKTEQPHQCQRDGL